LGLRHLAKREHERRLIAVLEDGLKVRRGLCRILQLRDQPALIGQARRRAASFALCALCDLRNRLWHV
jgi:hypothetical protein